MTPYKNIQEELCVNPKVWLITGVAGFIGSGILETLLKLNQNVVGIDNFETGSKFNLLDVQKLVTKNQWARFKFYQGDIRNIGDCKKAVSGVEYVLHQAALGSIPRSIENPSLTNETNITGFLNILVAARDAKVNGFVYAASSSTYGDHPDLPKIENKIGRPLSPYAITKLVNELYANIFFSIYGFETIGLRYFNVFGRRQDPAGAYAAVIPKWILALMSGQDITINGDGTTSRDFCYIDNVIEANILAATTQNSASKNNVYNVAFGQRTTLNELQECLINCLQAVYEFPKPKIIYKDFRVGDIRHSLADISKAKEFLGYQPEFDVMRGLGETVTWYVQNIS